MDEEEQVQEEEISPSDRIGDWVRCISTDPALEPSYREWHVVVGVTGDAYLVAGPAPGNEWRISYEYFEFLSVKQDIL